MHLSIPGEPTTITRIFLILVVVAFIFGYFVFKLFTLQVTQYEEYAQAADQQSTSISVQQAQRGQILASDRDGKIYTLAASQEEYQLLVAPRQVIDKENLAEVLVDIVPALNEQEVFEKINNDKVYVPPLIKGLTREKADEIIAAELRGVYVQPNLVRVYPDSSAIAAQILGYVGADGQGKYGVEAAFDKVLRGVAGSEQAKQDSFGRLIEILGGSSPEPGKDIMLTIDYNLQFFTERRLKDAIDKYQADAGSIIIMEAKTGAVLAIAGQPTYDPNFYSTVKVEDQGLFLTPGASFVYEAGSVVKPITMAMAIDLGLIEPDTERVFSGSVEVGGHTIRNADNDVFGRETMTQVLENSDNVAMVWVGQQVGIDNQYQYLEKFGFGRKIELGLVGEQTGILRKLAEWNPILNATAAFGQGFSTTLMQLVAAYTVLANDGETVQPHLVKGSLNGNVVEPYSYNEQPNRVISSETANKITIMLESVVVNGHGKRAQIKGVRVGGKTGTAQVASPTGGYLENNFIGTFAGIFPIDDPRFVMAVRLDNPKTVRFAESSAAPVFGEIGDWMANYYRLR